MILYLLNVCPEMNPKGNGSKEVIRIEHFNLSPYIYADAGNLFVIYL
jgi:hypothetical protein